MTPNKNESNQCKFRKYVAVQCSAMQCSAKQCKADSLHCKRKSTHDGGGDGDSDDGSVKWNVILALVLANLADICIWFLAAITSENKNKNKLNAIQQQYELQWGLQYGWYSDNKVKPNLQATKYTMYVYCMVMSMAMFRIQSQI